MVRHSVHRTGKHTARAARRAPWAFVGAAAALWLAAACVTEPVDDGSGNATASAASGPTCDTGVKSTESSAACQSCLACAASACAKVPTTCPAGQGDCNPQLECQLAACGRNCADAGVEVCKSGIPLAASCATCLRQRCCAETAACSNDGNCFVCLKYSGKNKTACDATTLDEQALGCWASKCPNVCLTTDS